MNSYDKVDPQEIIERLKGIIEKLKVEKKLLEKLISDEKNISNTP